MSLVASGCGDTCTLDQPCGTPFAIRMDISAGDRANLANAPDISIENRGADTGIFCEQGATDFECDVLGPPGTCVLDMSAPGYQATERTVVAPGTTPRCGCSTAITQHIVVALTPANGDRRPM